MIEIDKIMRVRSTSEKKLLMQMNGPIKIPDADNSVLCFYLEPSLT